MDIVYRNSEELVPYFQNPRVISDHAIDQVAKSIEDHGVRQAVVIDKDNVIVAGHTRLLAMKKLGIEKIPCVVYEDTEQKVSAYRLADNKVGELTTWDSEMLEIELEKLSDIEIAGFSEDQTTYEGFDMSQASEGYNEEEVGYRATDLTNQVPLTFYFEIDDRREVMESLEKIRDDKNLETKSNALLHIVRSQK